MTEYIIRPPEKVGSSLDLQPIIVGEIVRCRDCAYFATDKLGDYCTLFDFEDVKSMGDRFCAWVVKRTEGGE